MKSPIEEKRFTKLRYPDAVDAVDDDDDDDDVDHMDAYVEVDNN